MDTHEEDTTKGADDDNHHHSDETGKDAPMDTVPDSNTCDGVTGTGTENCAPSTAKKSEFKTTTNVSTGPNPGGTGDNRTLRPKTHTGGGRYHRP